MPNRDKTGPEGKGKRTGRGLGPCTNEFQDIIDDLIGRLRRGKGRRRGRGLGPGDGTGPGKGPGKGRGRRSD